MEREVKIGTHPYLDKRERRGYKRWAIHGGRTEHVSRCENAQPLEERLYLPSDVSLLGNRDVNMLGSIFLRVDGLSTLHRL